MNIIHYVHHGKLVAVQEHLRGKHWDYCLCGVCSRFHPDEGDDCPIAALLYRFCVLTGCTTPMWECPRFSPANDIEEKT